jgi:hypothetical protein
VLHLWQITCAAIRKKSAVDHFVRQLADSHVRLQLVRGEVLVERDQLVWCWCRRTRGRRRRRRHSNCKQGAGRLSAPLKAFAVPALACGDILFRLANLALREFLTICVRVSRRLEVDTTETIASKSQKKYITLANTRSRCEVECLGDFSRTTMAASPSVELDVVRVAAGPNHCPVDKGIDLTVEFSISADVSGYWSIQASCLDVAELAWPR